MNQNEKQSEKEKEIKGILTHISKATGVAEPDVLKVLDHLGLEEKLKELDTQGAKGKSLGTSDVKIAIKLGNALVVI